MAILKFKVSLEDNLSIFRDICVSHKISFFELHETILESYRFDNKHQAVFYKSNEYWERGKIISLNFYDNFSKIPQIGMKETILGKEIKDPHQRYIYHYDFKRNWVFLVELIEILKDDATYKKIDFVSGIYPPQYEIVDLLKTEYEKVEEKFNSTIKPSNLTRLKDDYDEHEEMTEIELEEESAEELNDNTNLEEE